MKEILISNVLPLIPYLMFPITVGWFIFAMTEQNPNQSTAPQNAENTENQVKQTVSKKIKLE